MRIQSISQVSQLYQTSSTTKKKETSKVSQHDALSISDLGKDYQVAKNAVNNAPDVRQDKVDSLKQSISDGSYHVSNADFADYLLTAYRNKTDNI